MSCDFKTRFKCTVVNRILFKEYAISKITKEDLSETHTSLYTTRDSGNFEMQKPWGEWGRNWFGLELKFQIPIDTTNTYSKKSTKILQRKRRISQMWFILCQRKISTKSLNCFQRTIRRIIVRNYQIFENLSEFAESSRKQVIYHSL